MSAPLPALQPFGKYLLDAELAQGGMARVFRARLRGPGGFEKRLVVKQILQELAQDPAFVELFVREANTLVQMSHPNIVPVYELGVVDGVYFLAMELVEGATVAELLRDAPLPEALCAHVGAQVCDALRYAHERFGLVHRDVTPRNVIADADGHVRLLDFGIAAPPARTGRGELFGSPGYMSPEQARGAALSAQSDLYGLGSVLYEALTGQPAQARDAELAQLRDVHGDLAGLVKALLAEDPAARPGSAAEVAARLRTWLSHRHPEGVARALGARVEQARAHAEQPHATPALHATPGSGAGASATPRFTRSIATNPRLDELMSGSTEALPRASAPARGEVPAGKRRRAPVIALLAGGAIALGAAAIGLNLGSRPPASRQTGAVGTAARGAETRSRAAAPTLVAGAAGAQVASQRQADAGTAGAAAPKTSALPAAGRARLSVNALPWAQLQLDGRALGTTPLRALATRAGNHVLLLDCPPLGRSARVPLKLVAGEHRNVIVDMNVDPPAITLR
jgi:serine/threonine-protein kinase